MPFIHIASSIPMLISGKVSCQFQNSTIMSISHSCSHVSQFQFAFAKHFTLVIGQGASLHPRTACACQFILVIGQVASSHPRTACTCQFVFTLVIGQVTSSNTRTACTCVLFLSSAKWLVRIQEQLVLPILFLLSAK